MIHLEMIHLTLFYIETGFLGLGPGLVLGLGFGLGLWLASG